MIVTTSWRFQKFVEQLRRGTQLVQGCRLPAGGGRVMPGQEAGIPSLDRKSNVYGDGQMDVSRADQRCLLWAEGIAASSIKVSTCSVAAWSLPRR